MMPSEADADPETPLPKGEGGAQAKLGRVRGYASAERRVDASAPFGAVPNPSSSHAFGAGPSFSLREKCKEAA